MYEHTNTGIYVLKKRWNLDFLKCKSLEKLIEGEKMETEMIIAIVGAIVGILGFIFGVYTHFTTRKVAKLTYSISQISDFNVPEIFLQDMNLAPVAIIITSRGNKSTENIICELETKQTIEKFEVEPPNIKIEKNGNQLLLKEKHLNPSQQIQLSLKCAGKPNADQIKKFKISHSEGAGIDEKQIRTITFSILGLEMEYDLRELKTRLTRIGPLSIKG